MEFSVSVIIPVYNCESYIEKAIISALNQPEVLEILVINDGSTDNTQAILDKLVTGNQKIKVFNHKNNINRGRSASRNLGIKQAKGSYIAFLDADDYYLHNRFSNDKIVFDSNKEAEGVYNAIGVYFYREASEVEEKNLKLTTVNEIIKSENLFEDLLYYKKGHFSIDGLTVKKTIFDIVGDFDESLEVSEDTNIILKMALKCRLITGIINEPVAMRGVHQNNIFNDVDLYDKVRPKAYESLLFWCATNNISFKRTDTLLNYLWILRYKQEKALFKNTIYWAMLFLKNQRLLFSYLSIKYFPLVRLRKKLFPFLYK